MRKPAARREEWGWWRDLAKAERGELRRYYRGLKARWGPFDVIAMEHARLMTGAWWLALQTQAMAIGDVAKRKRGRGRRPSERALERPMKRAGLNLETYERMRSGLEALAGPKRDLPRALRERLS